MSYRFCIPAIQMQRNVRNGETCQIMACVCVHLLYLGRAFILAFQSVWKPPFDCEGADVVKMTLQVHTSDSLPAVEKLW